MATTYLRQDQATISVPTLQGPQGAISLPFVKSWATLEGGDIEAEDTKTRPGGMVGQVNLGGPSTRTDATVTRPYTRELHPFLQRLESAAGNGAMTISWTILDARGSAAGGKTFAINGILKNVTRPNWDSNTAGAAMLSLVMGCNVDGTQSH